MYITSVLFIAQLTIYKLLEELFVSAPIYSLGDRVM